MTILGIWVSVSTLIQLATPFLCALGFWVGYKTSYNQALRRYRDRQDHSDG